MEDEAKQLHIAQERLRIHLVINLWQIKGHGIPTWQLYRILDQEQVV